MKESVKPSFDLEVKANISNIGAIETNIETIMKQATEIKNWYENLVITEDMLSDIKVEKSNINKAKAQVADYRKSIISEFKKPIDTFETMAKQTEKILAEAYECINEQVKSYEDKEKELKANEVKEYFNEYALSLNIDFVSYEQANINVTLSSSMKSLKESAKQFIDKVANDLKLIDTQENKIEILAEYKRTLDVSGSIIRVKQRLEAERNEKVKQQILEQARQIQAQIIEKVDEVIAPVEVKEEYTMTFTVIGTVEELKSIKNYLEERGIKYDTSK